MKKGLLRKGLVLGIIILLLLVPSAVSVSINKTSQSKNGNILYVGGSGEGNYTKIQDAIDNSSNGDTVFVYNDSSPYYENIVIDESINLVGEDKETTIIDGQRNVVVKVTEDDVTIIGFTLTNALGFPHMGIWADKVDYCTFSDNIIYSNYYGIELYGSNNQITNNIIYSITMDGIYIPSGDFNTIANNIIHSNNNWSISIFNSPWNQGHNNIINNSISNNYGGIKLLNSPNNTINNNYISLNIECGLILYVSKDNNITGNNFRGNTHPIVFYYSNNNIITANNIIYNHYAITLDSANSNIIAENNISNNIFSGPILTSSNYNTIKKNNISDNDIGIKIHYSSNNIIYHNNLIKNRVNAFDEGNNTWDDGEYGNYWSDYKDRYPKARKKPFKGIWDSPYEIDGGDNKDNYPLIKQWPYIKSKDLPDNPVSYSFYRLSLLERFPLLREVLSRLINL